MSTIAESRRDIYEKTKIYYWKDNHTYLDFDQPYTTTSMLCNQSFFDMPFAHYWANKVHDNFVELMRSSQQLSEQCLTEKIVYHRKLWEFIYIAQSLHERGMLKEGKKGVVFGVGMECLPAIFAKMGCDILATDLDLDQAKSQGWTETAQHVSNNLALLNKYEICPQDVFSKKVSYRTVNMNAIPDDIQGYDFTWSACALEHLGSIEYGLNFIKNSLKTLKSKGIAIHTTEFNLSSNEDTLRHECLCIYRKQDIEKLVRELEDEGHYVWPVDFHVGSNIVDKFIDLPPYSQKDMHLRLNLDKYTSTSIGLIIKKA